MHKVRTYNAISVEGLNRFSREEYEVASEISTPDAILLRSHVLSSDDIGETVAAIGRAGAGTNNVPVASCTEKGIPVFNAPGATTDVVRLDGLHVVDLGVVADLQGAIANHFAL